MELRTSAYLRLRTFPSGRALFALTAVRAAALARNNTALVTAVDRALAAAQHTRELERSWALQQRAESEPKGTSKVVLADRALDGELGALDLLLEASERRFAKRDQAKSQRIAAARKKLAPRGFAAIIRAVHEEEVAAVSELLATASKDPEVSALVTELGLADDLASLGTARDALATALAEAPLERIHFKTVTVARDALRERLCDVLAQGLAQTIDDEAARAALVGPIAFQDEDIRLYSRRRQPAPDVDPVTGEADEDAPALPSETD